MIDRLTLCSSASVNPYWNLALEERLFHQAGEGECILYLWQNERTVVLGRNQNARAQCRVELLEEEGGRLARRLSGGGAVFHDLGNLNFTFLVKKPDYDLARQLRVIGEAAASFGISTEISGRNDLLAQGRKFSGNAFYRQGERQYHHGTVLIAADMELLGRYLTPDASKLRAKGVDSVRARVTNLQSLCPSITVSGFREAMKTAFEKVYGLKSEILLPPPKEALAEDEARYASFAWLFGQERAYTLTTPSLRFGWGSAQWALEIEKGIVKEARLYTDGMNPELSPVAQKAVEGLPFTRKALSAALARAAREESGLEDQLTDLLAVLDAFENFEEQGGTEPWKPAMT